MSLQAMEWARKVQGIDYTAKHVLMMLAGFHNAKTGQCNPSREALAEICCMGEKPVRRATARLELAGLIEAIGSKQGGRALSISWALNGPGLTRFKRQKGGASRPPFRVIKGGYHETPLARENRTPKGGIQKTPEKGKGSCQEEGRSSQKKDAAAGARP